MDVVILIGRILFAAIFVASAIGHFTRTKNIAAYTESKGIRPGVPAVLLSGATMAVGIVMLLLGAWADLGALLLAAFLVPTAFLMHAFWKESDPQAKVMEQVQFNKDISLAGAALAIFGLIAASGHDVGLQLTGPLF